MVKYWEFHHRSQKQIVTTFNCNLSLTKIVNSVKRQQKKKCEMHQNIVQNPTSFDKLSKKKYYKFKNVIQEPWPLRIKMQTEANQ